jgi:hypothetical protein
MQKEKKLATLGTQDKGRRKTKHNTENQKYEQPHQTPGMNPDSREG